MREPVRVAWTTTDVVETRCRVCGGELLIVRLAFDEPTAAAKDRAAATLAKVVPKALVDMDSPKLDRRS